MGLRCKFASTANWFKSKIVSFETKSFLQIQNTQTICMRNKNIANVRTREEGGCGGGYKAVKPTHIHLFDCLDQADKIYF